MKASSMITEKRIREIEKRLSELEKAAGVVRMAGLPLMDMDKNTKEVKK